MPRAASVSRLPVFGPLKSPLLQCSFILMLADSIQELESSSLARIRAALTLDELDAVRVAVLGPRAR